MGPDGKKIRPGINPAMIDELTECNSMLSAQRKKRQVPPSLAPIDALERYTQISSHPLHKTNKPGILSIDIHPSKDIIATGGIDTNAVLFDRPSGQILCTLTGHSKKITSLKFVPRDELLISDNWISRSVEFDFSGGYLAVAGSDTRVYHVANVKMEWNLIKTLPDLSGTGSMDRNLRIFGLPGDEQMEEAKSPDR